MSLRCPQGCSWSIGSRCYNFTEELKKGAACWVLVPNGNISSICGCCAQLKNPSEKLFAKKVLCTCVGSLMINQEAFWKLLHKIWRFWADLSFVSSTPSSNRLRKMRPEGSGLHDGRISKKIRASYSRSWHLQFKVSCLVAPRNKVDQLVMAL